MLFTHSLSRTYLGVTLIFKIEVKGMHSAPVCFSRGRVWVGIQRCRVAPRSMGVVEIWLIPTVRMWQIARLNTNLELNYGQH